MIMSCLLSVGFTMRSGERFVGLARFSPEGPNAEPLRNQGSDSESSKGHDTLTTTRRRSQCFAKSKSNLAPIRATKARPLFARTPQRRIFDLRAGRGRVFNLDLYAEDRTRRPATHGQQHEQQRKRLFDLVNKC